jgi:hypothetical protein
VYPYIMRECNGQCFDRWGTVSNAAEYSYYYLSYITSFLVALRDLNFHIHLISTTFPHIYGTSVPNISRFLSRPTASSRFF